MLAFNLPQTLTCCMNHFLVNIFPQCSACLIYVPLVATYSFLKLWTRENITNTGNQRTCWQPLLTLRRISLCRFFRRRRRALLNQNNAFFISTSTWGLERGLHFERTLSCDKGVRFWGTEGYRENALRLIIVIFDYYSVAPIFLHMTIDAHIYYITHTLKN